MLKQLRFLFVALTAITLAATSLHAAAPLKVVSWNLEWFPGHRPTASAAEADEHMKLAKDAIKALNPDVLIGIEVRDWAAFNELVSVVPGLTTHVVSSFIDTETGEIRNQQIGIASKLTCRAAGWEPWKANIPNHHRGFSWTALEQKGGSLLMIYGNHLKSNRGAPAEVTAMRNDQAKQLIAQRAIMEKAFTGKKIAGWILAGDFNTNQDNQFPGDHVVADLTAAGFRNTRADVPQEKRLTWRGDKFGNYKPTTFDYIFTHGLGDLTAIQLDSSREVSDHHAIELDLPQE